VVLALEPQPASAVRSQSAVLEIPSRIPVKHFHSVAVRNFEQVIAAEPDWLRPHIELAALYYRLNRPEDGLKERAIVDKLYMQGKKLGPDAER